MNKFDDENKKEQLNNKHKKEKNGIKILILLIIILLEIGFIFGVKNIKKNKENKKDIKTNPTTEVENNHSCPDASNYNYNLIFNTMGGNNIEDIKVCVECDNESLLPLPIKDNNAFQGWYYDLNYTEKVDSNEIKNIKLNKNTDEFDCVIGYGDVILYAKWEEIPNIQENNISEISDEKLYSELEIIMNTNDYNEYAIKIIKSMLPRYQKVLSNNVILNTFKKIKSIKINPYDPEQPNLSHEHRAYYSVGKIVINCFEGELDNDDNLNGLKWLLSHEIFHTLGDFSTSEYTEGSYNLSTSSRSMFLEEGLADSFADSIIEKTSDRKFAVVESKDIKLYIVESNNEVTNRNITVYHLSGNIINLFKYVGCYNSLINSNINKSFDELKICMTNNVKDGDKYLDKLFTLINNMYIYTIYPDKFQTQDEYIKLHKGYLSPDNEVFSFVENNTLSSIIIKYAKLSTEIMNNKIDKTYDLCEFYKNNAILYSTDGINFTSNSTCN